MPCDGAGGREELQADDCGEHARENEGTAAAEAGGAGVQQDANNRSGEHAGQRPKGPDDVGSEGGGVQGCAEVGRGYREFDYPHPGQAEVPGAIDIDGSCGCVGCRRGGGRDSFGRLEHCMGQLGVVELCVLLERRTEEASGFGGRQEVEQGMPAAESRIPAAGVRERSVL